MLKLFLSPSVWGKKILLARHCGRVHCCVTSTLSGYMEIHKTLFFNIRLEIRLALGDQMTAWQYPSILTKLPLLYLRSLYFHLLGLNLTYISFKRQTPQNSLQMTQNWYQDMGVVLPLSLVQKSSSKLTSTWVQILPLACMKAT